MDYLKIGKASELSGRDYALYRFFEIIPGVLSWGTLLILTFLSIFRPVFVAYFLIFFDVYWLLLVVYLSIHLLSSYRLMKKNTLINWKSECEKLDGWPSIIHLIILPTYKENVQILRSCLDSIVQDGYPLDKMIVVLAIEEREGSYGREKAGVMQKEFSGHFYKLLITYHPDIVGELKGKGANQTWAAKAVKAEIIDKENLDYDKIMVSVFDIDTIVKKGYFHRLTYAFLTVDNPYRASYQPIPLYNNNVWNAPFFARVAASSNTFWQMMQQIREEKLATYSSHSMTWRALTDIGFWSTTMVSEDSRIFWHCFCYYQGDYRVEPLYFPVSMDVTMDKTVWQTVKNLYLQQRRWGWGIENLPYLLFNATKNWKFLPKVKVVGRIAVQLFGFHSWATNALIIGVIGWLPLLLGGDSFNNSVLSANLPAITRTLMTLAMSGLIFSAILSTRLLPARPQNVKFIKSILMYLQWVILPVSIIIFGSIPGLDAQTRLMVGNYLGFNITPKER
jgi:cellulose synthase/poly-beta-1,6-N-acetylglucosamine synthase-like glycosyltransferase